MNEIAVVAFKPISNSAQNLFVANLADYYRKDASLLLAPHSTPFFIIIWVTQGTLNYQIDHSSYQVKKDHLVYIAPGQIHHFKTSEGFDGELIAFTEDFVPKNAFFKLLRIFENVNSKVKTMHSKEIHIKVQALFRSLTEELKNDTDEYQHDLLFNMLYNLILFVERGKIIHKIDNLQSQDLKDVMAFKKLVATNCRNHYTVKDYADILDTTTQRLLKISTVALGKTPKEFITEHMLTESQRLLQYSNYSIKEISFQLGFDEPTNFTKFFKKQKGISPLLFRNSNK